MACDFTEHCMQNPQGHNAADFQFCHSPSPPTPQLREFLKQKVLLSGAGSAPGGVAAYQRTAWGSGPHRTTFHSYVPHLLNRRIDPRLVPYRGAGTDPCGGRLRIDDKARTLTEVNMPSF